MLSARLLWICPLPLVPALACANGTLAFTSDPGDPIGNGASVTMPFNDDGLAIGYGPDGIYFYKMTGNPFWLLDLKSGYFGTNLREACYERAERAAFHDYGRPGLDFSYNGSGCGGVIGRFKIIDLAADAGTGQISRLAVDFVQHCGIGPALHGKLRYNSSVTLDTPPLDPVFATAGLLTYTSDPGDFVGQGSPGAYQLNSSTFTTYGVPSGNLISTRWAPAPFAADVWQFDMAAPDGAALAAGAYTDVQAYPNEEPGHAGLAFGFYDGRGCSAISGDFTIDAVAFDRVEGQPTALQAHFDQHCELAEPALHGDVDFATEFQNGPLVADVLMRDGYDGVATWPLEWDCN
ncbi:MAG TPA: hypothetical protein VFL30_01795 [Rhodanobacteraceae bacterium]|nr:hypothetical protein [Rhodanobacteraceae bacterium]